ncbi:MAG: queuosine precursor transporter [Candidatus Eiseniibacteriota bacterium]|nr:MAG: queuosine precursor transporter [Candidatus Eisenbacteria bacterium]
MNSRTPNAAVLVAVAYVAAQMLADIASLKIVFVAGFSMDAGTLVYPFTFTLRDMVHKVAGIHVARLLIFAAAAVNLLMAGLFRLVAWLPADMQVGPQEEFSAVLSPVWRIVFASIVAEVVAELVDGETYRAWVKRVGPRLQWMRVLTSNSVSVPLDSAIFCSLAFGGVLAVPVVLSVFYANVIVKGIVTLVSLPWIYLVKEKKG